ncbi:hypothetical protein [Kribbella shirazensis]|uniref:Uncharacterized protein n=1 Tax=Kribbella shirazensis TaxID=1105143 RepID=A0A7X5VIW0_9ACTN|nr:hypothetical protein [Kribbella shirazensis]NIK61207.1 hypothetical protein [Kribbella shirazensis]
MTRVDHRRPPARAARKQHRTAARRSAPAARPRKAQRSHSAIGAAIVAGLAIAAVFAFILTRGTTAGTVADGLRMGSGTDSGAAAPADPTASPTGISTKADRKPPVSAAAPKPTAATSATKPTTPPPVNTGPTSPKFKRGQWIAVLDKYPADAGQTAKDTATRITRAGIPAKAMLVDGQYPGFTDSSLAPVTGTWVVYLGPGSSSEQMLNLCLDPRTQAAYPSACPTYEPAS